MKESGFPSRRAFGSGIGRPDAIGALANLVREARNGIGRTMSATSTLTIRTSATKPALLLVLRQKGGPRPTRDDGGRSEETRTHPHIPVTEIHMVAGFIPNCRTPTTGTAGYRQSDRLKRISRRSRWSNCCKSSSLPGSRWRKCCWNSKRTAFRAAARRRILTDRVHDILFPKRDGSRMAGNGQTAHGCLPTNATMLYGILRRTKSALFI